VVAAGNEGQDACNVSPASAQLWSVELSPYLSRHGVVIIRHWVCKTNVIVFILLYICNVITIISFLQCNSWC
jgi:hypothetical protein